MATAVTTMPTTMEQIERELASAEAEAKRLGQSLATNEQDLATLRRDYAALLEQPGNGKPDQARLAGMRANIGVLEDRVAASKQALARSNAECDRLTLEAHPHRVEAARRASFDLIRNLEDDGRARARALRESLIGIVEQLRAVDDVRARLCSREFEHCGGAGYMAARRSAAELRDQMGREAHLTELKRRGWAEETGFSRGNELGARVEVGGGQLTLTIRSMRRPPKR
jgi:chromosome segregation ATPase